MATYGVVSYLVNDGDDVMRGNITLKGPNRTIQDLTKYIATKNKYGDDRDLTSQYDYTTILKDRDLIEFTLYSNVPDDDSSIIAAADKNRVFPVGATVIFRLPEKMRIGEIVEIPNENSRLIRYSNISLIIQKANIIGLYTQ